MNPVVSQLQSKFPLSPKKFWKKFLEKNIIGIFLAPIFILGFVLCLVFIEQVDSIVFGIFGVILGLLVIGMVLSAWYIKVYIRTYFYEGEPNYLTIRKGVFTSTEIHVPYMKIQDVYVDQDFWDRYVFGLYDVHIASATATSGIEAHIDGVEKEHAEGLKHYLLNRLQGGNVPQTVGDVSNNATVIPSSTVPTQTVSMSSRLKIALTKPMSSDAYPIIPAWWVGGIFQAIGGALGTILVMLYLIYEIDETDTIIGQNWVFMVYVGIFVLSIVWQIIRLWIFKNNYRFEFRPEYLYLHTGVFSRSENHMPYSSVQDVQIKQSFLDRILGVYTVSIQNASGASGTPNYFDSLKARGLGTAGSDNAIKLIGLSKQSADEISGMIKVNVLGMHDQSRI